MSNEFTTADRALLGKIAGGVAILTERSVNQEKRLDGHGTGIRQNRDDVDDLQVYEGKCQTRWKGIGYVVIPILGTLAAGLVKQLFF